ncbi:hypothetical protein CMI47_01710 [Candidatus Pacearchaeota archaeon]|nr:hypothetical protein [Candidatus Pacearchaeota archaeon]|tara:strand:+ start:1326 stop:1604 length:279 start_codon:yes stop_codon:yes gene_type:complete
MKKIAGNKNYRLMKRAYDAAAGGEVALVGIIKNWFAEERFPEQVAKRILEGLWSQGFALSAHGQIEPGWVPETDGNPAIEGNNPAWIPEGDG